MGSLRKFVSRFVGQTRSSPIGLSPKLAACLIALLLPVLSYAHAESIVVRAFGPITRQAPAGTRLADGLRLRLGAGDRLVVLDRRGTRDIRGPTVWTAGSRDRSRGALRATWGRSVGRSRIAGTRDPLEAVLVEQAAELFELADAALEAGEWDQAGRLLSQIESVGFEHRAQCRLHDNLRLFLAIAAREPSAAERAQDPCLVFEVAEGGEEEEAALLAERESLLGEHRF